MLTDLPAPVVLGIFALGGVLIPSLFFLVTPFIKLSIVFGVLRTGFGTQGIPGTAALTALSMILSFHVMEPIFGGLASELSAEILSSQPSKRSSKTPKHSSFEQQIAQLVASWNRGSSPLKKFLSNNAGLAEIDYFSRSRGGASDSLAVLIPAFVLSELRTGFKMALYLFLPFLIIDVLVTTILTGMGMMMVNPVMLSFPLKLLFFVECDGWMAVSKALVVNYAR